MNLFNKIPDNFFNILSSKNKNIYGIALVSLYDALILYHNHIRKSDYIDLLKSRGEEDLNLFVVEEEDLDEEQIIKDFNLYSKANLITRRLVKCGWIVLDVDLVTGAEYILLPSYSISMLKLVYDFITDGQSKYVSYVHSTYADLSLADNNQDQFMYRALMNAVNNTRDLELEVTKLDHSIRVYHKNLSNLFSPNEVLTQHFDFAREDVVDPIYHPLKTNDSISLYNGPISTILKKWLNTEIVRNRLIDSCLILNTQVHNKEEAEKDIIKKINFITDTYHKLSLDMEEIDKAQSNYVKATTEKVIYLNNQDKTIKGKLETIFLSLAKLSNGDKSINPSLAKDLTNSITLYHQGYIDEDSLTKPIHRDARYEGDPLPIDEMNHEVNEGLMQSLLEIADMYSEERVFDYMEKVFGDKSNIEMKDINVKDVEDYVMMILATIKSTSRQSFYNFTRPDNVEIIDKFNTFDMPNYQYHKKETK